MDFFQGRVTPETMRWVGLYALVEVDKSARDQDFGIRFQSQPWNLWVLPAVLWTFYHVIVSSDMLLNVRVSSR